MEMTGSTPTEPFALGPVPGVANPHRVPDSGNLIKN